MVDFMGENTFTKEMVQQILNVLSVKNHFFVSEAHLQTEFIIEAAKLFPNYQYYPELVPSVVPSEYIKQFKDKGIHFDLVIRNKKEKTLIEFKYLTAKYHESVDDFDLEVKSHMAMDIRRYDCWKDISRIECFVKSNDSDIKHGYFILITNVPGFWKKSNRTTLADDFLIFEGRHKRSLKQWSSNASEGTKKGRFNPLDITMDYLFEYRNFYNSHKKNGQFKSLIVEVKK